METVSAIKTSQFSWRLALVILLLLAFAVRLHRSTTLGTQSDEGLHITIAERLSSGDTLYGDLFENRTPLVEWVLAVAFLAAGPSIVYARFFTVLVSVVSLAGLILGGRLLYQILFPSQDRNLTVGIWIGLVAAILFAFSPLAIFWGRFVMLEHWQAAASILAICGALLAAIKSNPRWWLLSGFFSGMAILSKQGGVVVGASILLYLLLLIRSKSDIVPRRSVIVWGVGLLAPLTAMVVVLFFQSTLDEFFGFISGVERLDPFAGLEAKLRVAGSWSIRQPLFWLAVIGVVDILNRRIILAFLPVIWLLAELVVLFFPPELDLSWGGFSHYAIPAFAALSMCGAIGVAWLARSLGSGQSRRGVAAICLLLLLLVGLNWSRDLKEAIWQNTYPQPDMNAERKIGALAASFTREDASMIVFGNSIFYHWANRRPASIYLHYPAYLSSSPLALNADSNLVETLANSNADAVLVSRMHLEDRLSKKIKAALLLDWEPVALIPYAYQRDIFLFRPADDPKQSLDSLAEFEQGINLLDAKQVKLSNEQFAVRLEWVRTERLADDLTVFVHLLSSEGMLVSQHDSVPSTGFRPTDTWQVGEHITDWHILSLPPNFNTDDYELAIGLYDSTNGERLLLKTVGEKDDAYLLKWAE